MKRIAALALCLASAFEGTARGQASRVEPVRVSAGTILTFFLHPRLNSTNGDSVDGLPEGTLLRVKMLDSIDSAVNPDGTEFHGAVVSGVASSGEAVIHPESEVRGILVLLRSRSHPEGFRYELLITSLTDRGKSHILTASLNPSLADSPVASTSKTDPGANPKSSAVGIAH